MRSLSNNSIPVQLRKIPSLVEGAEPECELMVPNGWVYVNRSYVEWAVGNLNVRGNF